MENITSPISSFPKVHFNRVSRNSAMKILPVLVLPLFGAPLHAALFLVFALWALRGPRQSLEALSLSCLATFLNPGIYTLSNSGEVLRWGVLLASFFSVSLRFILLKQIKFPKTWWWLLGFVLVAAGLSFFTSYAFDVSLFKIITFFMGTTTILLGFHMTSDSPEYWRSWFLAIFLIVVVLGFPLLFNPLGYFRNQRGFQGLLNQPQAYGAFLGPLCVWLLSMLLCKECKGAFWWVFLGAAFASLVATQSRTGMFCFVISPIVVVAIKMAKGDISFSSVQRALRYGAIFLLLFMPIFYLSRGSVMKMINDFLYKNTAQETIDDALYASRGFIVIRSFQNFLANPILGIGFGLASDPATFVVRRNASVGLPLGASVEKGVLLVAILEEVGIIGFLFFAIFLASLLFPTFRRGASFSSAILAVSVFLINFGEAVFFAVGGMGLWMWLLIGVSRTMSRKDS